MKRGELYKFKTGEFVALKAKFWDRDWGDPKGKISGVYINIKEDIIGILIQKKWHTSDDDWIYEFYFPTWNTKFFFREEELTNTKRLTQEIE